MIKFRHINTGYFRSFILALLTVCVSFLKAQEEELLKKFHESSVKEKVTMVSDMSIQEIRKLYPLIKDTLQNIKTIVAYKSRHNEAQFLFSLIDAKVYFANGDNGKAVFLLNNALQDHAQDMKDSIRVYQLLVHGFENINNFIKVYEIYTKLEKFVPRAGESVYPLYGIKKSGILARLGLYTKAIHERRAELLSKADGNRDTLEQINYHNDLGVYFNRMKRADSAEANYKRAAVLVQSLIDAGRHPDKTEFLKALVNGNLGFCAYNKGEIDQAIPLLLQDIYFSNKHREYESAFNSYMLMADCELKKNRKKNAARYLDTAQQLLNDELNWNIGPRLKYYKGASEFYHLTGDYKQADLLSRKYAAIEDSIAKAEKEQDLENTEISLRIEKKELELQEMNKQLEQQKLQEQKEKTIRVYSGSALAVLLLLSSFLFYSNRISKRKENELAMKNEQIRSQKDLIEQSLKEKEVLLREIHHRVKNNLQIINSMLSLHISKTEGTEKENVLREAKQRITSIALTHQMLYQNAGLSNISFSDYVTNLVKQIKQGLPDKRIEVRTDIKKTGVKLNIDLAVPLGLLINELLTNAYKHAFPGNRNGVITVKLDADDKRCLLSVSYDGVGLPKDFDRENRSMGMELIHILSEQIGARLKILSDEKGTCFETEINLEEFN